LTARGATGKLRNPSLDEEGIGVMGMLRTLAVTIALFTFAPTAQAQTIDLSKVSCKDFAGLDKDSLVMVWAWLYGYYADQDADPIIDFKDLASKGAQLVEFCAKNPTVDMITAAEPIYEKK
jgi:acid stress chaperone HdeB